MKKFIISLVLSWAVCMSASAQNAVDTVTVKKSDLPPEMIAKIEKEQKVQEITHDLKTAQEWSGIGKEIGVAVNDGLKAVTEQTANFAKTDVGKMTMLLIAWKVMAKDVLSIAHSSMGFIIGVPMLLFINWFAVFYYRRTFVGRQIKKTEKGWLWWKEISYETVPAACIGWNDDTAKVTAVVIFWVALFIGNVWTIAGCIL